MDQNGYTTSRNTESTPTGGGYRSLADDVTRVACKMLEDGSRARQTRFADIKKNEDMYFGVITPALKGRSNIPFDSVVMGGFIDALCSNTNQSLDFKYGHTREQDKIAADKISAVQKKESAIDRGDWDTAFDDSKFLASLAGVGFLKLCVEGTPKFTSSLSSCDHYDMVMEPTGGGDLDKHLYKFQMNIFRTKGQLTANALDGFYDKAQVGKLIKEYGSEEVTKQATDLFNNKQIRYATFGIDIATMGYVGQPMYRLTEGVVNYDNKWYYIVFSYECKMWVRFQPLEEVFEYAKQFPGRGPWRMFQTHRHPFISWTKATADDIRPIGYSMKKILNYSLDNLEKKNWGQRAYDPKMFTDPTQLLWKQDGLVRATVKPNQNIANGIFEFQTPDTTNISINLIEWLNNFAGKKVGVSSDVESTPTSDRVGIVTSNLEQTTKRFTLLNKKFKKAATDIAAMFDYELHDKLREEYAVKIIGNAGAQWEEVVTRQEMDCEFSVEVKDSNEEEQKNTLAAQKRELAFQRLDKNPALAAKVNSNEYLRIIFEDAGLSEERIATLLDVNNEGDANSSAEAAQAIQDALEGKPLYKLYRDATPAFIVKIMNFCADNFDLIPTEDLKNLSLAEQKRYSKDIVKFDILMAYAQKHIPIAQKNMERKAVSVVASMATQTAPGAPGSPAPTALPNNTGNVVPQNPALPTA